MHGLGLPRLPNGKSLAASPPAKYNSWEKQPPVGGTLESIVNPAAIIATHRKSAAQSGCRDCGDELVPWFEDHRRAARAPAAASLTLTMDALVPCSNSTRNDHREPSTHVPKISACPVGCSSTCVGSCSAAAGNARLRRMNAAAAAAPMEWGSKADQSASGSATCGRDSRQVTLDTCDREFGTAAYTSTSFGSPENTSSGKQCTKTVDDQDSPCQSRYEASNSTSNLGVSLRCLCFSWLSMLCMHFSCGLVQVLACPNVWIIPSLNVCIEMEFLVLLCCIYCALFVIVEGGREWGAKEKG